MLYIPVACTLYVVIALSAFFTLQVSPLALLT